MKKIDLTRAIKDLKKMIYFCQLRYMLVTLSLCKHNVSKISNKCCENKVTKYPSVANLIKRMLRVSATSAPVERVFSHGDKAKQTCLFLTQLQLQQNELKLKTQNAQNKEKSLKLVTK